MMLAAILATEVLFWVLILAGLVARYLLRRPRLGLRLLATAPLVDLLLLTMTVIDLRGGGVAHLAHALAAIYIGVSVGFGHRMIAWADVRFAHRFAGGPAPAPKPRYGVERARYERAGWYRHLLAWAVGAGLLMLAHVVIGDASRTQTLVSTATVWTVVLLIDAVIAFSYTLSPRRAPRADETVAARR